MEAQECIVATKLSYVLLPNSIGKTTLDCKNIVVDNDHDEKASASLFSKIMKEIQSFVPEKETERYSAVLYKDKEQKICVDTPEKFTKEIVKDYNKKQPLRQLKYVTSKLEHLKYQLSLNAITHAVATSISEPQLRQRYQNTHQTLQKLNALATDKYFSLGFTLPYVTLCADYINTNFRRKENAITKISQLAARVILNLLQYKNTRNMILDDIARRDIQLVERICKVYTTRSDVSIKRRQDEFVMVLYSLVSTNDGLDYFMAYNEPRSRFRWLYVLQKQLEYSRNISIQHNILESFNFCLSRTQPGDISIYQHHTELPTLINEKIFCSRQLGNILLLKSKPGAITAYTHHQMLRIIHISYAIFTEYKDTNKRFTLGTASIWKQHIQVLQWLEQLIKNRLAVGQGFKPSNHLLLNIVQLIGDTMLVTVSVIGESTRFEDALEDIISQSDLYFLLRLSNDAEMTIVRPLLCNIISKLLCASDSLALAMAKKETIIELMALSLFTDTDNAKNTSTHSVEATLNIQLCLALVLRAATAETIESVISEPLSLIKEFFNYAHNKIVLSASRDVLNDAGYKGHCMVLSACIMCFCKTTQLGKHRKTINKVIFYIIEASNLRNSWMKYAGFALWLIAQDEHQSRILIAEHHPVGSVASENSSAGENSESKEVKTLDSVNILASVISVVGDLAKHLKRTPKPRANDEVGKAKRAAFLKRHARRLENCKFLLMAIYGIISESSRHNAKIAITKMNLLQVLVDVLSLKQAEDLDQIMLLAVKCLWVAVAKPINTKCVLNEDASLSKDKRKKETLHSQETRNINDSKTINDLDLPLPWLLGELPILLASVASFEQYNTKTRLTTSEFLQVLLTLSNKVDTTPIEKLSLVWLKSKSSRMRLQSCRLISSLSNSCACRKRLGKRGAIPLLFDAAEFIGNEQILIESLRSILNLSVEAKNQVQICLRGLDYLFYQIHNPNLPFVSRDIIAKILSNIAHNSKCRNAMFKKELKYSILHAAGRSIDYKQYEIQLLGQQHLNGATRSTTGASLTDDGSVLPAEVLISGEMQLPKLQSWHSLENNSDANAHEIQPETTPMQQSSDSVNVIECHDNIEASISNTLPIPFDAKNDFLDWVRVLEEEDDNLPGKDISSTGQSKYSVSNRSGTNIETLEENCKETVQKKDLATPKKDAVAFRPWKTLPDISKNAVDAQKYRQSLTKPLNKLWQSSLPKTNLSSSTGIVGVKVSAVASRVSWAPPIITDNFPEPDDSYMYEGSLITLPGRRNNSGIDILPGQDEAVSLSVSNDRHKHIFKTRSTMDEMKANIMLTKTIRKEADDIVFKRRYGRARGATKDALSKSENSAATLMEFVARLDPNVLKDDDSLQRTTSIHRFRHVEGARVYDSLFKLYQFQDGTKGYYYHTDTMYDATSANETYTIKFPTDVSDLGLKEFPRFDSMFEAIRKLLLDFGHNETLEEKNEEESRSRSLYPSLSPFELSSTECRTSISIAWPIYIHMQYKHRERKPVLAPWTIETSIFSSRRKEFVSDDYYDNRTGLQKVCDRDWEILNRDDHFVTFLKAFCTSPDWKSDIYNLKAYSKKTYPFILQFFLQTLCDVPLATQLKAFKEEIEDGKELLLQRVTFDKFISVMNEFHVLDTNDPNCNINYVEKVMKDFVATVFPDHPNSECFQADSLNRCQFYGMLVIVSLCKYHGEYKHTKSVAQSFELFSDVVLKPKVKSINLIDPNSFRKQRFYNKKVEKTLKDWMKDLKIMFKNYSLKIKNCSSSPSNVGSKSKVPVGIIPFNQWLKLTKKIEAEDHDFDIHNIKQVFLYSKPTIRNIYGGSDHVYYSQGLTFIDFMEALGRLSDCKTYPTKAYLNDTLGLKTYAEYRKQLRSGVLLNPCPTRKSREWGEMKTVSLSWKLDCLLTDFKQLSRKAGKTKSSKQN